MKRSVLKVALLVQRHVSALLDDRADGAELFERVAADLAQRAIDPKLDPATFRQWLEVDVGAVGHRCLFDHLRQELRGEFGAFRTTQYERPRGTVGVLVEGSDVIANLR